LIHNNLENVIVSDSSANSSPSAIFFTHTYTHPQVFESIKYFSGKVQIANVIL